jgi:hypothetical protein
MISLRIYDVSGRLVRVLVDRRIQPASHHAVSWDSSDDRDQAVASGIYIYQLNAGPFRQARRMVLLR